MVHREWLMDKLFHPALWNGCNYLSMLGLKIKRLKGSQIQKWSIIHHIPTTYNTRHVRFEFDSQIAIKDLINQQWNLNWNSGLMNSIDLRSIRWNQGNWSVLAVSHHLDQLLPSWRKLSASPSLNELMSSWAEIRYLWLWGTDRKHAE